MNDLTYEKPKSRRKPKGPTAVYRARRKRADDARAKYIRAKCVIRDGYCKFWQLGDCSGDSQHMHLGDKKRARTRGMAPEVRHTMEGSCMGCERHHTAYDRGRMAISMFADLGAMGPIRVNYKGRIVMVGQ